MATGETFRSLAFSFRVGRKTVATIVQEVCKVLWEKLSTTYMKMPQTEEWLTIAANFEERWDFPHCIGAIDGKHVLMKAPWNSGSLYFNNKGSYSIVLLALVDANLKFIYIDVGAYGRNSDGGIFKHSNLGKALGNKTLGLPSDKHIRNAEHLGCMPYVMVGDEAFPLQKHLMRPYPGRGCPYRQQAFNYRLSRARRVVENAFGILASRWRVKATCCLHNMLQRETTMAQINKMLQDNEQHPPEGMGNLLGTGNRFSRDADSVRKSFTDYFVDCNALTWQNQHIMRGTFD